MYKSKEERKKLSKEKLLAITIFAISVLCFLASSEESSINEDYLIKRPEVLEGEELINIKATIDGSREETILLPIGERSLSFEECDELYESFREELFNEFLGENQSSDNIIADLNFPDEIEGYPFEIEWNISNRDAFESNGRLIARESGEASVVVRTLYGDWQREEEISICYHPKALMSYEEVAQDLYTIISESESESRDQENFELPKTISGYEISYIDKEAGKKPIILMVGALGALAVLYGAKADEQKEQKKRRELIEQEYAVVLQKIVMYLSAGMTLRNIWIKVYEESIAQRRNNPIYEEIKIMINEIRTGVSEQQAYTNFSSRIGLMEITRMTTLLSQNLKKGSTNLAVLLKEEARNAFENRKRNARVKGEEAGTKLLAPMTLLLVIVMAIIMVPAFFSI